MRARPGGRALSTSCHSGVLEPHVHRPVGLDGSVGRAAEGIDDLFGRCSGTHSDVGWWGHRRPPARRARHLDRHGRVDVERQEGHQLIHETELRLDLRYAVGTLRHRFDWAGWYEAVDPPGRERLLDDLVACRQPRFDGRVITRWEDEEESSYDELRRTGHGYPPDRWGRMRGRTAKESDGPPAAQKTW